MSETKKQTKFWCGPAPAVCDICDRQFSTVFIDGRTRQGPWANMCPKCHVGYGVGIGIGKGQQYEITDAGRWQKVA